ncbi:MAG TPA: ATP-binding cassette domain-containing protein [Mycobacteriales bacterium]|nr:ATP-binding cassette domain-containing protein [Mycobacteriales bacterium]
MIEFDRVTVSYPDAAGAMTAAPVLRDISLGIDEGELCLVVGATGVGKSTLLGAVNGLVPHFTGGSLAGDVRVGGLSTRDHPPRDLAHLVGVVGQDPLSGFVTDVVEDELAYTMEQLGTPPDVMRKRVEETLDLLGLAELRRRALHDLSGGQQQRVAIGAALTGHPKVLVLDEPTSALDPTAAEEVLAAITRIVHDLGVTVLLAEHRLERVVQYADRVIHLPGDGTAVAGEPATIFTTTSVAPPVVELGRLLRWSPLPMSVRDARRRAGPTREQLASSVPAPRDADGEPSVALSARNVVVRYGDTIAVRGIDLDLDRGAVTALMGRNGSGKSSLLWAVHGAGRRQAGTVAADGGIGLVPQTPADLLYLDTVRAELDTADRDAGPGEPARVLLDRITPGIADDCHPRDLSEGQRLALVLAIQLRAQPEVVLLDEPTRGLDYSAKRALGGVLRELAEGGHAVVVATHDVEFVAAAADRVVVLGDGDVVADGRTAEVVVASPAFAPQVAKILAPLEFLTVDAVEAALAGVAG